MRGGERGETGDIFFSDRPMSEALRLPLDLPSSTLPRRRQRSNWRWPSSSSSSPILPSCSNTILGRPFYSPSFRSKIVAVASTSSSWSIEEEGPPSEGKDDRYLVGGEEAAPASIELETVSGEEQFDRIIAEAQQLEVPVVVIWMANWCRKCIYLKPKLEKLATDYHPRIRFYYVDVNSVPHNLVKRAGITKMPTIQLWRDSLKQAEVIGGYKAWLVIDDIRHMIENVP